MPSTEQKPEQTPEQKTARLSVRLAGELKEIIEEAAGALGQSVSEFAVSTLAREAREVLDQSQRTRLSRRDWELFIKTIEDTDREPNERLKQAARRYRERTDVERTSE